MFFFSSFWTVECHPDGEIRSEVFKAVNLTGGHEQKGTGLHRMTSLAVKKLPFTSHHEINLVSCVGLLRIVAYGRVELYRKRTVRKDRNGNIACRRRTFG